MSRLFGWSYPPGCSGPPDDEPHFAALRCRHCQAFVGGKPVRIEPYEATFDCKGEDSDGLCGGPSGKHQPHKVVMDNGQYSVYKCKRCGNETKIG